MLNRRADATERLLEFAESYKAQGEATPARGPRVAQGAR